jgi:hypothetical protein
MKPILSLKYPCLLLLLFILPVLGRSQVTPQPQQSSPPGGGGGGPTQITLGASPTTICPGTSILFSVTAFTGDHYYWYINGVLAASTTGSAFSTTGIGASATVYCTIETSAGANIGTSNTVSITVNPASPPSISITASATSICPNTSVTFTASPTNGGTAPTYQWLLDGSPISGATGSTYTTSGLSNGQVISCVLTSNATCLSTTTATSNGITMTVTPLQSMGITISGPSSVCSNAPAIFTASVTNQAGDLTYQWYKNGNPVTSDLHPYGGGTYATAELNTGDVIYCKVTTDAGCYNPTATSNSLSATVSTPQPFTLGFLPSATTFCQGQNITYSAQGSQPVASYQWYSGSTAISGATSSSYTTAISSVAQAQSISVIAAASPGCLSNTNESASASGIAFTMITSPGTPGQPSGVTALCQGGAATYTTAAAANVTSYTWSVVPTSAGTFSGSGTTGTIDWSPAFSGTATVGVAGTNTCFSSAAPPLSVTVTPSVGMPGSPSGTLTRNIGSGTSTYTTSGASNATGYTWSITPAAGSISGTGTTGTVTWNSGFSGSATVSVTASGCNGPLAASTVITVYPPVVSGTISPSSQAINYNTTPTALTATAATGGAGGYTYQWYSSSDDASWVPISGATGLNYSPGVLTTTTYYLLQSISNGAAVNSAVNEVLVYPPLASGTISPSGQAINYNTTPTALTASTATGGAGGYTYQWYSAPDGVSWVPISGATSLSYSPGALTATTYYLLQSRSNGVAVNSAANEVSVYPPLMSGTISPSSQVINYNTTPTGLTATAATGGAGGYTYQWYSSLNNGTWTAVSGATGLTYSPGTLTASTYYHIVSTSNGASVTSGVATVTVYAALVSGSITPSSQSINYSTTAAALTATAATGGAGGYTYQWYSSPNNSTWTAV